MLWCVFFGARHLACLTRVIATGDAIAVCEETIAPPPPEIVKPEGIPMHDTRVCILGPPCSGRRYVSHEFLSMVDLKCVL